MEENARVQSLKFVKNEDWSYDESAAVISTPSDIISYAASTADKMKPKIKSTSDDYNFNNLIGELSLTKHDIETTNEENMEFHTINFEEEGGVYPIYIKELLQAACIRTNAQLKANVSQTMKASQEDEITKCFKETNYLRACLADAYTKKQPKSSILMLYGKTSLKEVNCRKLYASTVLASALHDASQNSSTSVEKCNDWKHRIKSDILVVEAMTHIKSSPEMNATLDLRTKHAFDFQRAKAILKADQKAFASAWPQEAKQFNKTKSTTHIPTAVKASSNDTCVTEKSVFRVVDEGFSSSDDEEG